MGSNEKGSWMRVKQLNDVMRKIINAALKVQSGYGESAYEAVKSSCDRYPVRMKLSEDSVSATYPVMTIFLYNAITPTQL